MSVNKAKKSEETKGSEKSSKKSSTKPSEKQTMGELDAFSDLKAMFDSANSSGTKEKKSEAKKPAVENETTETTGDDLKKINGVGPAFEKRLNALGIFTYDDLINLTDEKIAELETQDSMTSLDQWHAWMEEAKALKA